MDRFSFGFFSNLQYAFSIPHDINPHRTFRKVAQMVKYRFKLKTLELMGIPQQRLKASLKLAILDMEYALESHAHWTREEFQSLLTKAEKGLVGSVSLQKRWVKKYQRVLRLLYSLEVVCG